MLAAGCSDGDGAGGTTDLRPAADVLAERNLEGQIGGPLEAIDSGQGVFTVGISAVEERPRCEPLDVTPSPPPPDGSPAAPATVPPQMCDDHPLLAVTTRIENRGGSDSESGVAISLLCAGEAQPRPMSDLATLDAQFQDIPSRSFVEGIVVLSYPESCPDAAIVATPFVTFGVEEGTATARWPLPTR